VEGWSSAICECIEIPTECNKQSGWEKDRIWETDGVIFSWIFLLTHCSYF
jgi:hypothetical protein